MGGTYHVTTLGCKVNQYESQQVIDLLKSFGYSPAGPGESADIAVVNSCAVTGEAVRKSRQAIRRRANHSHTEVFVIGCGASAAPTQLRKLPGVVALFGHESDTLANLSAELQRRVHRARTAAPLSSNQRFAPPEQRAVNRCDQRNTPGQANTSRSAGSRIEPHAPGPIISTPLPIVNDQSTRIGRIEHFAGHQRAFLKVQDGCDAHCTYCIIPSLRPMLRSKPIDEAVAEARRLVSAGHKEIIVTGIFLGAFGRETAQRRKFKPGRSPLASLITALGKIEGLARLRLSSLEPGDVDEHLLEAIATSRACVPHLHLPLQSGGQKILRAMNRQYSRADFLDMIDRVRRALEKPAISTDMIVGFPGESEKDFQDTLDVANHVQFCKIHAFPFSPRQGTAASRWGRKFVSGDVVRDRMRRLAAMEQACSLAYRRSFLGRTERVLVERSTSATQNDAGLHLKHGRADRYFMVHFDSAAAKPGDLIDVRLTQVTPTRTHGTPSPPTTDSLPLPVLTGAN